MSEGTHGPRLEVGAAEVAPTAPHATPRDRAPRAPPGPERFWASGRRPFAGALAASLLLHYLVSPISLLPSGPDVELKDQEGELVVPVDLEEGPAEPPPPLPAPPPPQAVATEGPTEGPAPAPTKPTKDAGAPRPDASALAALGDAGRDAETDAETDAGSAGAGSDAETPEAGAGDAALLVAEADAGTGSGVARDPEALLGAAGSVSAGPNNVTVLVNMEVIKAHPLGPRLQPILAAIPQWRQFMTGSTLDPYRDTSWILITGPSLADTERDAVFVGYTASDAEVDKAIDGISRAYVKGGKIDVGVPGVKAWRAYADRGERVFLRPRTHLAVIVPSSHAKPFAQALVKSPPQPKFRKGEAVSIRSMRPGGSVNVIPQSISELRLWIVPRPSDGGADVWAEGDCPDASTATQAADSFRQTVAQKNSLAVKMVTGGLLNHVEVTSEGAMVKLHLTATKEQIEAILGLVGAQLGVPASPPSP